MSMLIRKRLCEKTRKNFKKVLTRVAGCDILLRLSERHRKNKQEVEKTSKKFEKALDKQDRL